MRVVVVGGGGFLGRLLIERLCREGAAVDGEGKRRPIDEIVCLDRMAPASLPAAPVRFVEADVTDAGALHREITPDTGLVYHLAAVVSGAAEADFDLGMRVNVHGTLAVLEAARASSVVPQVVFTSSVAAFGGLLPEVVDDGTPVKPSNSYGVHKAIGELLLQDYSRKGFIDGRALRLPGVVVRPGRPNAAASSYASSILREPLAGEGAICPVTPDTPMAIISPARVTDSLIAVNALPAAAFGDFRTMNLPGLTVTAAEMVAALERIAGPQTAALVEWQPDPVIQRIVGAWPKHLTSQRALAAGFRPDPDIDSIIRAHIRTMEAA